jgi:hypothetical protein
MLPSAAIHRSGWQDLFVARELDYVPYGADRYFMLVIKALAALMGGLAIALGPVAPLILESQQLSALFSETAEDIAATRQTTAFAGQRVIYSIITQGWVFIAPAFWRPTAGGWCGPSVGWAPWPRRR